MGPPATMDEMERCEERLGVRLLPPVREMYRSFDGLQIEDPRFAIYSLEGIKRCGDLLVFCVCDHGHRLALDTRELNEAGEWFIVNAETGYRVTYTVGSLLATRMWSWVQRNEPIWFDLHDTSAE